MTSDPHMFSVDRFYYFIERTLKGGESERMEIRYFADLYTEILKLLKHLGATATKLAY